MLPLTRHNDTLGHPIGDKLLKEVAFQLSTVIKPADMITRFGGDEFVVLQTGTDRRQDAEWLAQRVARTLKEPFEIDGHRMDIGASIGIAMAPHDGVDVDQLLKKADMALYAAKTGGGGMTGAGLHVLDAFVNIGGPVSYVDACCVTKKEPPDFANLNQSQFYSFITTDFSSCYPLRRSGLTRIRIIRFMESR